MFFAPKGVFKGRKFFRILSLGGFEMWIFCFGVVERGEDRFGSVCWTDETLRRTKSFSFLA